MGDTWLFKEWSTFMRASHKETHPGVTSEEGFGKGELVSKGKCEQHLRLE